MKRFNWRLWSGLLFAIVAFFSYFAFFARFAMTRDVPWASFILFLVAMSLLVLGWRRAERKILPSIVVAFGVVIVSAFTFYIIAGTETPPSYRAPAVGQMVPAFTLPDTKGSMVSLGDTLNGSNGVLLVFYRGFW